MGPGDLSNLLRPLQALHQSDERVIVGTETSDDAGVYMLDDGTALVQTIDVITPVVDDPMDFGSIAAVNALSDIYAMGGTPLTALTFLAFEPCELPLEQASLILEGALRTLGEHRCAVIGGHTLEDREIKFGLAVTGTVHPDRVITNRGAREGDLIYLTKPLGTGIASTALKGEMIPEALGREATDWMKRSNGPAASCAAQAGIKAATDVTGFGLLGHLREMCDGSGLGARVDIFSVPLMEGVLDMVMIGMVPEGAYRNRDYLRQTVSCQSIPEARMWPLYDPQTSGGLLMAVSPESEEALRNCLEEKGVPVHRIGMFRSTQGIEIRGDG